MSRRAAMNSCISPDVSSAYTWSPRNSTRSGRGWSPRAIRSAYASSASTPCSWVPAASCETLTRQDPNTSRSRPSSAWVLITGGGYGESGSGHTCSPSTETEYGVVEPGWRPDTSTSA
jgi:hypothetical protein